MVKKKLAKLIDLKSIITLILVVTLIVLVIKYGTAELITLFCTSVGMVLTYFFTRDKKNQGDEE